MSTLETELHKVEILGRKARFNTFLGQVRDAFGIWLQARQQRRHRIALLQRRLDLEDWKLADMGFERGDLEVELERLRRS